jgi:hypothetical protein
MSRTSIDDAHELLRECNVLEAAGPPGIVCSWIMLCTLIAQVQLALRHPQNTSTAAATTRALLDAIIFDVALRSPPLAEFLQRGFDPALDVDWPDRSDR